MGLLTGRRALIVGIASERSLAAAIATAMAEEGAELVLTYQNERLRERVEAIGKELGARDCLPCEVTDEVSLQALGEGLAAQWDGLEILVHAVAFAPAESLRGRYIDSVTREASAVAHDVSAYSLTALARATHPLLSKGRDAALLTLSYLGAERAVPNYNIMGPAKASLEATVRYLAADLGPEGIRVNAISAGPVKTLAASGISGFRTMLQHHAEQAPLRRNIEPREVGRAAVFLCSPWASAITGEVLHVDAGYHAV